ncbi:MAG TPA: pyridoxal phosphate-dependent aminotransferase, partial [Devosia sp.]|nr:pyridoxal phosphate-dependent aminotransferase [Devosia sp.]
MGRIQPSATVGISQMARQLAAEGRDIIALSAGEPDFDTPEPIKEAARRAMDAGKTKYTNIAGIAELREAVADKFRRENGLDVVAEDCFVASGGKQIIFNALLATLDPGDEVVVPVPYWVSYPDIVRLAGATPVFASAGADTGFKITPEKLRAVLSERTRWLILNSPSNPTGAAYGADELAALGAVLRDFPGVLVLSDDIYEHLLYDGGTFATLAQVCPDLADRIVTLNGVSKAYSMTGWRIGYCAAPRELLAGMAKLQGQSTTNACSISQWAAFEALTGSQDFL